MDDRVTDDEVAATGPVLAAFGVSLEDLMFRVPPRPDCWKGMLAAEAFILAARQLEAAPGVAAEDVPGIAEGIMRLASQEVAADADDR